MTDHSVVVLLGRMGNQLFQFSFGRWLQTQGQQVRFDVSGVRREQVTPVLADTVSRMTIPTSGYWPAPLGRLGAGALTLRRVLGPHRTVVDLSPEGMQATTGPLGSAWWIGYWQQARFAEVARDELRSLFAISGPAVPRITVHVRRGDYVTLGASLPGDWYHEAVREAHRMHPGLPVAVVSDDPLWCRQNLPWPVAGAGDPGDDFRILATSEVVVASPSTFSWWACYMGPGFAVYPSSATPVWESINGRPLT